MRYETNRPALGLGVDELLAERLPVIVGRGVLDDDLLVVIGELVDDVLQLLGELELVVGGDALLRDGRSAAGLADAPYLRIPSSAPSRGLVVLGTSAIVVANADEEAREFGRGAHREVGQGHRGEYEPRLRL